ncbi:hypothetical protein SAMN05444062_104280 [Pseudomonas syringae]|nr:hypothetical protein SAMN05444062_104280 [Pseudomonas syringae]
MSGSNLNLSEEDAERPEVHTHAEHGYDGAPEIAYRSSLCVRTPFVTLRVTRSGSDAERPEMHTHAEYGYDDIPEIAYRSSRSA